MELLRLSKAAKRLGVHPVTLRLWADSGKIPVTWVGRERRFSSIDVEAMKVSTGGEGVRLEGLYVRVSGSHGGGNPCFRRRRRSCGPPRRARSSRSSVTGPVACGRTGPV
ncbi:helix-turn-helix domain-containing protein [Streptomyces sp. CA-106110]|uniref:helix-turn-helix domain-containing protein n=1 Tax=Streptomyces sp. CA-106110 TaxID=3240044 RepID=UPI003D8DD1D7